MNVTPRAFVDARRRPPRLAIVAGLAAAWIAGCDVRDERVRTTDGGGLWPAARESAPGGSLASGRDAATLEYVEGYEAASRLAAAEGRPLLLVFGASWCRWSGELARGPLADPDVVTRTRRFVCVLVDADREGSTCRAFDVTAFPTLVVVDADGRECFRSTGATGSDRLAAALDAVPATGAARRRLADDGSRSGDAKDVTR